MTREAIKDTLRKRIVELRQQAFNYRMQDYEKSARESEARALECERTLDLFSK